MSRATVILDCKARREQAAKWCLNAPLGTRLDFKEAKRSTDQNAAMWAALTEVARQVPWHGIKLSSDDYKLIFLDALKREVRMVPNLDGNGFVSLGRSSSDLSKQEMSELLEIIYAWGASKGVVFHQPEEVAA